MALANLSDPIAYININFKYFLGYIVLIFN